MVEVEPGDSVEVYTDQSNHGPFDTIDVTQSDDGTYRAFGSRYESFEHCIPAVGEHFTDEARREYIDERSHLIERFVTESYDDVDVDHSADVPLLEFNAELGDQAPTEEQAIDAVWENSSGVRFANEMDPGSFGSPDASAQLREVFDEYDSTKIESETGPSDRQAHDFAAGMVGSFGEDMRMSAADDAFGEVDPDDAWDMEFDPNSQRELEEAASRFAAENWGDLHELSQRTGRSTGELGHDLYMEAAGHGVGFSDRASVISTDRVISERLSASAQREWSDYGPDIEHSTAVGDDGSITV